MISTTNGARTNSRGFLRSRGTVALIVFLAIVGFLLIYEHRAHIPGDYWLLGGLVGLCLMLHGLMHRGHGGDRSEPDKEA